MSRLLVIGFGLLVLYLDKSKCDTLHDLNVSEGKLCSLLLFHVEGLRSLKAFTFHSSRVDLLSYSEDMVLGSRNIVSHSLSLENTDSRVTEKN